MLLTPRRSARSNIQFSCHSGESRNPASLEYSCPVDVLIDRMKKFGRSEALCFGPLFSVCCDVRTSGVRTYELTAADFECANHASSGYSK